LILLKNPTSELFSRCIISDIGYVFSNNADMNPLPFFSVRLSIA
jgi:hypothetical protein